MIQTLWMLLLMCLILAVWLWWGTRPPGGP